MTLVDGAAGAAPPRRAGGTARSVRFVVNAASMAPIGGVEVGMLQVNRRLAERGHDVDALYVEDGALSEQWRSFARTVQRVPSFDLRQASPWHDLRRLAPAVWAARQCRPDVVYLNRAEQWGWGLASARAARAALVVHVRTPPDFPAIGRLARLTDHFIAVSDHVRRRWTDAGVPAEKISTVHNGVDPADYPFDDGTGRAAARASLGLPADGCVVLYYGRIAPEKGIETLLEAWRRLGRDPREARLVLAGTRPDGAEGEYARRLQAQQPPGCVWLPQRPDVVPLLHAADLVVLPATWEEPFGRVVIEAMATGRPMVASPMGGIAETMTGVAQRWRVPPGDAVALAERIATLEHWRTHRPGLAAACRQHVLSRFPVDATVDGVERVLRRHARRA